MNNNTTNKKNIKKKVAIGIVVVLIAIIGGALLWMTDSYKHKSVSTMALKSDDSVVVTEGDFIVFDAKNKNANKGFIFYPGAKVDPMAYAPLCRQIASAGYKVVIVPMPLNFAIFSPNKASEVIEKFPQIETWAIGGHSLGGVMACSYAAKQEKIKGVVLYASYPEGDELKNSNKKVLSLWGSQDGVAKLDKVKNAAFPKDATLVEIKGGNHGQFGDYGAQSGDNKATISQEEQVKQAVDATLELMEKI